MLKMTVNNIKLQTLHCHHLEGILFGNYELLMNQLIEGDI